MALNKIDVLSLGRGSLKDNDNAIIAFSANNIVADWSAATTYAQYNIVEHSGKVYRSKVASNLANDPTSSPSQWETLYSNVKDGDICFVISGADSTILQRANGTWKAYRHPAIHLSLTEGAYQSSALTFIGGSYHFAKMEYTIKRGSGEGRKRVGTLDILNDGTSDISYSHEFTEIGDDVNVWLTPTISAGIVDIKYDSAFEGNDIFMEYKLLGWD